MEWWNEYGYDENGKELLSFYMDVSEIWGKLAEPLEIMPELFQDLEPIYNAFWQLCPSKNINGRIPLSEILAYCQLKKIQDIDDFIYLIQKMDAVSQRKDK